MLLIAPCDGFDNATMPWRRYGRNVAHQLAPQGFLSILPQAGPTLRADIMREWPQVAFEHTYRTLEAFNKDASLGLHFTRVVFSGISGLTTTDNVAYLLGTTKAVCFEQCEDLEEAAAFDCAKHVAFEGCPKLVSVSKLALSDSVSFTGCPLVKMIDVMYNLAGVKEVTLDGCPALSAIGELGGNACIKGVAASGKPHEWKRQKLSLANCGNIKTLRGLETVHTIGITGCAAIGSLAGMSGVHTATIANCSKVRDVSPLNGCHTITVADLPSLRSVGGSELLNRVTISNCEILETLHNFHGVATVRVSSCAALTNVREFGAADAVRFESCGALEDLEGLGACRSVTLDSCGAAADLSPLATCSRVHLRNLKLVDLLALHPCREVVVEDCQLNGVNINTTFMYGNELVSAVAKGALSAVGAKKGDNGGARSTGNQNTTPTHIRPDTLASVVRHLDMARYTAKPKLMVEARNTAESPERDIDQSATPEDFMTMAESNMTQVSPQSNTPPLVALSNGALDDGCLAAPCALVPHTHTHARTPYSLPPTPLPNVPNDPVSCCPCRSPLRTPGLCPKCSLLCK